MLDDEHSRDWPGVFTLSLHRTIATPPLRTGGFINQRAGRVLISNAPRSDIAATVETQSAPDFESTTNALSGPSTDGLTTLDHPTGLTTTLAVPSVIASVPPPDPYKTESVAAQCQRLYKVAQFSWSPTHQAGQLLTSLNFPKVLTEMPFLKDKFKDYLMMRADVEYYVRLVATPWQYGSILFGHVPYYNASATYAKRTRDLTTLSQCNAVELSVVTAESATQTIKWTSPHAYQKISTTSSTEYAGTIGHLAFRVLNPLRTAGGGTPTPVQVQVYARFVNLELAGYCPIEGQSSVFSEAAKKTKVFSGVPEAVKTVSGVLTSGLETLAALESSLGPLGPLLSLAALDKPIPPITPSPSRMDTSPTLVHGRGVDVSTKLSVYPEAAIDVNPGFIGAHTSHPTIQEWSQTPTLLRSYELTSAHTPGSWLAPIALHPLNCPKLAQSTNLFPGGVWSPTHLAYISSFFKFWRGGLKLWLSFHTSANVQADVRIAHIPDLASWTTPLAGHDGDMVTEVIRVSGHTTRSVLIPWLSDTYWKPTGTLAHTLSEDTLGVFTMCLESPIQSMSSDIAASIYVNVWIAGAEDYSLNQFAPLSDSYGVSVDPGTIQAQAVPGVLFREPFTGIRECTYSSELGVIAPERVGPVVDLLHRYHPCRAHRVGSNFDLAPGWSPGGFHTDDLVHWLLAPFLFYRGSIRLAFMPRYGDTASVAISCDGFDTANTVSGGHVAPSNNFTPFSVEMPWYTNRLFNETVPTHPNARLRVDVTVVGANSDPDFVEERLLWALGDDVSIGPLSACPVIGKWESDVPRPAFRKLGAVVPSSIGKGSD